MNRPLSIYVHYPFCKSKCPYCDFNSHLQKTNNHLEFLTGYKSELEFFAKNLTKRKIQTIFFGGGTPSLMPLFLVEGILSKISELWEIDKNCEITLEANPTSFESAKFKDLKRLGINRLSLGIQSLKDSDLKFLGRNHSAKEAIKTIELTSKIFDNFSFDLIYARPNQTLKSWLEELSQAISFGSKHLSLYQLTIEKGTRFFAEFANQKFTLPDEENAARFYEITSEATKEAGFKNYEISNYSQKNFACRHNLTYWQGGDYLGIGAGAHSRVYLDQENERIAIQMLCSPSSWLEKTQQHGAGIQKITKISKAELLSELILSGLRIEEGISNKLFQNHFQKDLTEILDLKKLAILAEKNLIEFNKTNLRINESARLLTNSIINKILEAIL